MLHLQPRSETGGFVWGGFKDNSKLFKINVWLDYDSKKYEVKKKKEKRGDWGLGGSEGQKIFKTIKPLQVTTRGH